MSIIFSRPLLLAMALIATAVSNCDAALINVNVMGTLGAPFVGFINGARHTLGGGAQASNALVDGTAATVAFSSGPNTRTASASTTLTAAASTINLISSSTTSLIGNGSLVSFEALTSGTLSFEVSANATLTTLSLVGGTTGTALTVGQLLTVGNIYTVSFSTSRSAEVLPGTNSLAVAISIQDVAPPPAVPEPTSLAVFGLSLCGVVLRRKR